MAVPMKPTIYNNLVAEIGREMSTATREPVTHGISIIIGRYQE
jgi:hypothetical protein